MKHLVRASILFALALTPAIAFAGNTGTVKPGDKKSIYRNTEPNKRLTVSVEVTCNGAKAVPGKDDPNVTEFIAGYVYTTQASPTGNHKCVIYNGDGTPETCELTVDPGVSVVLEAHSDKSDDAGCEYSVMVK